MMICDAGMACSSISARTRERKKSRLCSMPSSSWFCCVRASNVTCGPRLPRMSNHAGIERPPAFVSQVFPLVTRLSWSVKGREKCSRMSHLWLGRSAG